jgi:hypothetical protein
MKSFHTLYRIGVRDNEVISARREYYRKWRLLHPDYYKNYLPKWGSLHPGYYTQKQRERRARNNKTPPEIKCFTPEEDSIIKFGLEAGWSDFAIARWLGRSVYRLRKQRQILGLTRQRPRSTNGS